jgi:hypothetical protein
MRIRWHYQALTGAAIALYFIALPYLFSAQGYFTIGLFGNAYGLANIKSSSFLVVGGHLVEFPFSKVCWNGGGLGLGVVTAAAWRHFRSRRALEARGCRGRNAEQGDCTECRDDAPVSN